MTLFVYLNKQAAKMINLLLFYFGGPKLEKLEFSSLLDNIFFIISLFIA